MATAPKRQPSKRTGAALPLKQHSAPPVAAPTQEAVSPNVGYIRPELANSFPLYQLIRDCIEGEFTVKRRDFAACGYPRESPFGMSEFNQLYTGALQEFGSYYDTYLVKPNARDRSIENTERFKDYIKRAVFYNVTARTLEGLVGAVFIRAPLVMLPPKIAMLENDATGTGVSLVQQSKRLLHIVMSFGRAGLLVDYPKTVGPVTMTQKASGEYRPNILVFDPWQVVNWRTTLINGKQRLSLVVIAELQGVQDDGFETTNVEQYRVMRLDDNGNYTVELWQRSLNGNSNSGLYYLVDDETRTPTDGSGKPFKDIPFTFVGPQNNDIGVDRPPIYDLASLNMAHYRNSADYEEACYITGQPTLCLTGLTEGWVNQVLKGEVMLGSRGAVMLPVDGDAKMLQAEPNIMPESAMEHKEAQMVALGARLVEAKTMQRTATEAVIDESGEQSILTSATANANQAILWALGICCAFEVQDFTDATLKFELNTEIDLITLSPEDRKMLLSEWQSGGIAFSEYRHNLKRGGIARLDDTAAAAEIEANPPLAAQIELASIAKQATNDSNKP